MCPPEPLPEGDLGRPQNAHRAGEVRNPRLEILFTHPKRAAKKQVHERGRCRIKGAQSYEIRSQNTLETRFLTKKKQKDARRNSARGRKIPMQQPVTKGLATIVAGDNSGRCPKGLTTKQEIDLDGKY